MIITGTDNKLYLLLSNLQNHSLNPHQTDYVSMSYLEIQIFSFFLFLSTLTQKPYFSLNLLDNKSSRNTLPSVEKTSLIVIFLYFGFHNPMNIQQLRQENKKLKELHASCQEQLQKLKETGKGHEAEIDTLLKFNERLLGIIENQFNSATKSKISSDLQIIAETNQSTDLGNNPKFKNKLVAQPPRIKASNQLEQQLEDFDQEEEEQIYNQEKQNHQQNIQPIKGQTSNQIPKTPKLDKVFELQNKEMQVSVNLSSSVHNSFGSSIRKNERDQREVSKQERSRKKEQTRQSEPNLQLQQLREMIKQYKQQFVENSAEYQQICVIIHNDLLNDLQEFKKLQKDTRDFYKQQANAIVQLRQQIKRFKPANELMRVMKQLNVPNATERLLQQRIVNRHL